jgi:hypothetical protein
LSTTTHHGTMPKPLPARSMIRPPFFGFPILPCSCGPLKAYGCASSRELQWADPICRWLCMESPVVIRVRSVFPSQVYRGPNDKGREQKKKHNMTGATATVVSLRGRPVPWRPLLERSYVSTIPSANSCQNG